MNHAPDPLFDALDPAEREALQRALPDGDDAEAFALWQALRARLGADLRRALPDFDLIVLYALADADASALSPEEEARLIAAQPDLQRALTAHPSLGDVVRRVRADHEAFEAAWSEGTPAAPAIRPEPIAETASAPRARAADRPAARASRSTAGSRRWVWRSAVAVALVAFVGILLFIVDRDAGFETYVAEGEPRLVTLDDGSTVVLAEGARLMAESEDDGVRLVRLTGEALFEVVPGTEPFVVETATAITTVLGTTFGVEATEIETEVILANGAVEVATRVDPDQAVRLEPGQRSRVVGGQPPEAPMRADVVASLAWTGTWYFHNAAADEVAGRFAEHYGTPIVLDPSLEAVRVGGAYSADRPVEESVQALAVSLGASVEGTAERGYRIVPLDR